MFPKIVISSEDTLSLVEKRLAKAVFETANQPGIKPIYTMASVKQEASRLYQNLLEDK